MYADGTGQYQNLQEGRRIFVRTNALRNLRECPTSAILNVEGVTVGEHELSVKAAAALAGISERHVRRLLNGGAVRGHQVSGWFWVVDLHDLQRWVRERNADQNGRRR